MPSMISGGRRWQTIELEVERSIARLRFNRPDSRNGVVSAMLVEVYEALRLVAGCPEIDVLAWTMRLAAQAARIRGAGQAEQPAQQRPLA